MDKSSNQLQDHRALKKQLALFLVGSSQNYQNYKRTQQISSLYPNDLDYYNDPFYHRHERNISELNKLKQLLKERVIKPQMLLYNTWNTFYPSYILHHHYVIYTPIISLFKQISPIKQLISQAKQLKYQGIYLKKIININFQKQTQINLPILNDNNYIQMNKDQFYFDKHVSLYYHIACFIVKKGNDKCIVFVNVRDRITGQLNKNMTVKDLGERISLDYLQIAYNFNQVQPFLCIKINNESRIQQIHNMNYFYQFGHSLLDLKKSLYLSIKYTTMRQQFKTLPRSKSQRPIISYQAVGSRIINAFAKLVSFSQIYRSLLNNSTIIPFAAQLLDINHHLILESIIRLRQCCGGFGYLQVAGHGAGIQRVSLRASEAVVADLPENPEILKRLHYYSSSDDMQSYFGDMITKQIAFNPSQIFAVFVNICVNMRKSSSQLRKQEYLRHFMHQSAIQILKTTQQFSRFPKQSLYSQLIFYQTANYIIDNSKFINWKFIQKHLTREQYYQGLLQFRNNYLNKLLSQIPLILQILEVNHVRNVVIGRQNKEDFYHEVFNTSKKNLRNSQEFVEYVKRPIVELLYENNKAKL